MHCDHFRSHRGRGTMLGVLVLVTGVVAPTVVVPVTVNARPSATVPASMVFDGVTVVDVAQGKLLPDQRVVIAGTRIQAVGGARTVQIPRGTLVVEARGKYLIPGLWDMHVHTMGNPQVLYPHAIATGVTGVREMNTPYLDSLLRWRREIAAGTRVGPRTIVTGGVVTTPLEAASWNTIEWVPRLFRLGRAGFENTRGAESRIAIGIRTTDDARRVVDSLKMAGVDFIKIRTDARDSAAMPRDIYFAIAAAARRAMLPLVGHLPPSVTAAEASDSGQHSLEHSLPCHASEECAAAAARFSRNGTWIMPAEVALPMCRNMSQSESRCVYRPTVPALAWTVLPTLAGTDKVTIDPFTGGPVNASKSHAVDSSLNLYYKSPLLFAVYGLQSQLARFVAAGMTPLASLQTATLNPAKYLNALDSLGTVEPGKLADLVLLDANPLDDIWNTTKIWAVIANGRYFDRSALERLNAGLAAEYERTKAAWVAKTPSNP